MAALNQYLDRLKSEQSNYAFSAIQTPDKRDAFEYGQRCGVLEGLLRAERLLLELIDEDKKRTLEDDD